MTDINSAVIPIVIMLLLVGGVTACIRFYFRYERHRTEVLTAELAKNREQAERAVRQQERSQAQIAELTGRVAALEQLLRNVG
ncbi:hypothetical protein [Sinosporangium siamense]|uniref:Uncharacterized protein n=1 Tax=Sinosporangium siamense TaxID=1367973 RepID=A0A919RIL5_9ACTN|nr:hypothetical protein [Sinosporangium siamense]GII94555.1 hypothetical protein Ssi02_47860 [Sinosporangium siamense]